MENLTQRRRGGAEFAEVGGVKERPILFNTEMVWAILEGRKTETRRVVKPQPDITEHGCWYPCLTEKGRHYAHGAHLRKGLPIDFPLYRTGDLLWVRETWCKAATVPFAPENKVLYKADGWKAMPYDPDIRWRPSIHLPKRLARIWLQVKSVGVERVQDITEDGAKAEGVRPGDYGVGYIPAAMESPYVYAFSWLWDSLNEKRGFGWERNPWVWVVKFRVVSTTGREGITL